MKVDWTEYNAPPFFPRWLCSGETLKLVKYDDDLLDEIATIIIQMADQYDIENIEGILLDRIGKNLGVLRNGKRDDVYRSALKLKILLTRSKGTVNDIIKVIKYMYGATHVTISPDYPAGIRIVHNGKERLDFLIDAYFSNEKRITLSNGNYMVFSTPDYSLDELVASAFPTGIGYTIEKET